MDNSKSKMTNLFIVGAPKCGTTSLHFYLNQHPDIFFLKRKEPHYFSTDFHLSSDNFHGEKKYLRIRHSDQYQSFFDGAACEKYIGEASTSYLYSAEAAKNIYEYNMESKIIICLRDPLKILLSWHSYLLFHLEEDVEDFHRALEMEDYRAKSEEGRKGLPLTLQYPERVFYREFIKLGDQIKRFTDLFPRENILFVVLEELQGATEATYKQVLDFLGVDASFEPDYSIKNAKKVRKSQLMSAIQKMVRDRLIMGSRPAFLKRYTPESIKKFAYKITSILDKGIDKANIRDTKNNETEKPYGDIGLADIDAEVRQIIEEQVEALEKITEKNLSKLWGY